MQASKSRENLAEFDTFHCQTCQTTISEKPRPSPVPARMELFGLCKIYIAKAKKCGTVGNRRVGVPNREQSLMVATQSSGDFA